MNTKSPTSSTSDSSDLNISTGDNIKGPGRLYEEDKNLPRMYLVVVKDDKLFISKEVKLQVTTKTQSPNSTETSSTSDSSDLNISTGVNIKGPHRFYEVDTNLTSVNIKGPHRFYEVDTNLTSDKTRGSDSWYKKKRNHPRREEITVAEETKHPSKLQIKKEQAYAKLLYTEDRERYIVARTLRVGSILLDELL